jgi:hypothetical protein
MKRFFILLLALVALVPITSALADTISVVYEDGELSVYLQHIDEEVEKKLDQFIEEFELTEECKTVIINYTPDINSFDRIEREAMAAYRIIMKDGTMYYLSVNKNAEPMCLQSSEKDSKTRTRYYDKFAK